MLSVVLGAILVYLFVQSFTALQPVHTTASERVMPSVHETTTTQPVPPTTTRTRAHHTAHSRVRTGPCVDETKAPFQVEACMCMSYLYRLTRFFLQTLASQRYDEKNNATDDVWRQRLQDARASIPCYPRNAFQGLGQGSFRAL